MERVKKGYRASLWTVGAWGLLINLAFVLAPGAIAGVFFYEPKAIKTAVDYLVIVGFSEAFLCVELTTVGALSGLGRTKLCSIISIIFTSCLLYTSGEVGPEGQPGGDRSLYSWLWRGTGACGKALSLIHICGSGGDEIS